MTYIDTFMLIYGSKFQIPIAIKSHEIFDMSQNVKNQHLTVQKMASQ